MKNTLILDFNQQIERCIEHQSLVELHFLAQPKAYHVGIILHWNKQFFVFADIFPEKKLGGICIHSLESLNLVKLESDYLTRFNENSEVDGIRCRVKRDTKKLLSKTGIAFLDFVDWLVAERIPATFQFLNNKTIKGSVVQIDEKNMIFVQGKQELTVFNVEKVLSISAKPKKPSLELRKKSQKQKV